MTTLFTTPLFAQTAAAPSVGGMDLMSFLPMILIFAVFYFLLIRPQQKKAQEQKNMVSALQRGDRVLTAGGLIGLITKVVNDQEVQLELADGVRVRLIKSMVLEVIGKDGAKEDASAKADHGLETKKALSVVTPTKTDAKVAPKTAVKAVKKADVVKSAKK